MIGLRKALLEKQTSIGLRSHSTFSFNYTIKENSLYKSSPEALTDVLFQGSKLLSNRGIQYPLPIHQMISKRLHSHKTRSVLSSLLLNTDSGVEKVMLNSKIFYFIYQVSLCHAYTSFPPKEFCAKPVSGINCSPLSVISLSLFLLGFLEPKQRTANLNSSAISEHKVC